MKVNGKPIKAGGVWLLKDGEVAIITSIDGNGIHGAVHISSFLSDGPESEVRAGLFSWTAEGKDLATGKDSGWDLDRPLTAGDCRFLRFNECLREVS
jgi:hypothetical protein